MRRIPTPTAEEYEIWRNSPVTAWVMRLALLTATRTKMSWQERAWGGALDPVVLAQERAYCEALADLATLSHQAALEMEKKSDG